MKKLLIILLWFITSVASATNWYFKDASQGGDDAAAGTSDETARATITKFNLMGIGANDSVFFKCDGVFRPASKAPMTLDGTTIGNEIYYGSYGTGAKPLILGSLEYNSTDDWVNAGTNLWRNSDSELDYNYGPGNIIFDNEASTGVRIFGTPTAQGEWDWHNTGHYITLYSVGNPATFYSDIEVALGGDVIRNNGYDYITIDGLDVRYGGRTGIESLSGSVGVIIRNCDVSYIGGGLTAHGTVGVFQTRLGNGIEFYQNCSDILIERNHVSNIFEAGISPQYYGASTVTVNNFVVQNNIIEKCEYSFEYSHGTVTGSTVNAIIFRHNTCRFAGEGWAHNQRYRTAYGVHMKTGNQYPTYTNCYLKNNIFSDATEYAHYHQLSGGYTHFDYDYNMYDVSAVAKIGSSVYTTLAQWTSATGDDVHSLSGDPEFVSSTDPHLLATSDAINKGTGLGVNYDFYGNVRVTVEMGAVAYDGGEPPVATVTTSSITDKDFDAGTASGGGEVTSEGISAVTARGVCWNTTGNPTTGDDYTTDGSGLGAFSSSITGLTAGLTYYVRAYATNTEGTSYGSQVQFTMISFTYFFDENGKQLFLENGKRLTTQ